MLVQQELFSKELKTLSQGKELPPKCKLLGLSPSIDGSGLIRAQGRIRNSKMELDVKHPILLLSSHQIVWLYTNYMHEANNHQGVEYVRSCVPCKKVRATTFQPIMADLPSFRKKKQGSSFRQHWNGLRRSSRGKSGKKI